MHTSLSQQDNLQNGSVTSPNSNNAYSFNSNNAQPMGDGVLETQKKKIMIVEDEPDSLEIFVQVLSTVPDYEVTPAVDGADALAKIEAERGNFDLVILDVVMPKMDGMDVLTKLSEEPDRYGKPRVVMLTNLGGDMAVEAATKLGAIGYLMKIEVEPQQLLAKVKEFLAMPKR